MCPVARQEVALEGAPAVILTASGDRSCADWTLHDPEDEVVIGRGSGAAWRLDEPLLSRRHVRLSWQRQALEVTDLGSRNGSRVNGVPVRAPMTLAHGDRLEIGPVTIAVAFASRDPAATVGRPAPADHTQATQLASRPRARRIGIIAASLTSAALLSAGIAWVSGPKEASRPARPTAPSQPHPTTPSTAPTERASDDLSLPSDALRYRAIVAYAANRRHEARRLFRRLHARHPDDAATAVVLASLEP